jgi:predicted outer membrane repeat protein
VGATLLVGGTAQAAVFTVDSLEDVPDAGHTTLRDAIADAEKPENPGSTVTFASGLSGTITLQSQLPDIDYPTMIQGPGTGRITISGDDTSRLFYLKGDAGFPVTISGLTLTHGKATADNGGAIDTYNADLTISGVVLSGNTADSYGGAIEAYSGDGTLTVRDSTFTGNTAATGGGGAIYATGTPISIQNSTFSGNHAASRGSALGIDIPSGPSTIQNSTFSGNTAISGGTSRGGAIYSYGAENGVTVNGSTVVGNSATLGGGVFNHAAFSSPPVVLHDTIVANNSAMLTGPDLGGPFDSAFSLITSTSGATVAETVPGSDILGQDPQLGALASNGGPTQTRKPAATSPVVDQGSAFELGTAQRGLLRPCDAPTIAGPGATGADASDMGAVELQAADVPPAPAAAPVPAAQAKKKKCKKKKNKRSAESAKKKKCKKKRR